MRSPPFSVVFGLALITTCISCSAADTVRDVEQPRVNVVLIVADNQSPSLLGAYGNPDIKTPNIDRLAAEGIRFANAYAVSGVCSPTRAAILTGLFPSQTGVHNALPSSPDRIGLENWSAIEEFRTLPATLRAAGYQTALIGKYHLGSHAEAQIGFDHWVTMTSGHTKSFVGVDVVKDGKTIVVSEHLTDFWTDEAISFIRQRPDDRPFFLMLSYNGPYMLPPVVTAASQSRHAEYYRQNVPDFPQEPVHEYLKNWAINGQDTEHMKAEATHAWAAIGALNNSLAMINTAAETTMVDDGVGRVLDAISEQGLDEQTLVIYSADQGSSYGQHGLWGNTSWAWPFPAHESHLRIPLIVRQPGKVSAGRVSTSLVSQVDLFPTILHHVGLPDIEIDGSTGQAIDLTSTEDGMPPRTAVHFEFATVRGIRTQDWKYTRRFPNGPDELYFLRGDPEERTNLVHDAEYRPVRDRHRAILEQFFERHAAAEYDLWNGGTAKGRMLEDYGQNTIFRTRFDGWQPPFIRKATPFNYD